MADDTLRIYHRDLPHWRIEDAAYFVTWRVSAAKRYLRPRERTLVTSTLHHGDSRQYDLLAYVVMDDHVHVILAPWRGNPLERIVHGWKSVSAHRIGGGRVWQPEYQDRIIRNLPEFRQKVQYVLENPQRRWQVQDYPFVWSAPDVL